MHGKVELGNEQAPLFSRRTVCVGMTQPRWGWVLGISPVPRVAALPQPGAMGQNPVGIPATARHGRTDRQLAGVVRTAQRLTDVVRIALPAKKEARS